MGTFGHAPERAAQRDLLLVLLAAFGLAASITFVWLGMRAVMDIGGACADGGPFVPVQPCPAGAPAALTLGMLGLFGFGGLGIYAGVKVGGPWAALPLLGWPALFLSLGWNFLEYGFTAGGDEGLVWGWIVPGVLFVLMGGIPLWVAWLGRSSVTPVAARFGLPHDRARSAGPAPSLGWDESHRAATGRPDRPTPAPDPGPRVTVEDAASDPVERLERLADLRRRGEITTDEYERFKAALLRDAERRT
jgi:hypothetical protein